MKILFAIIFCLPAYGIVNLSGLTLAQKQQARELNLTTGTGLCAGIGMYQDLRNNCYVIGPNGMFGRVAMGGGLAAGRDTASGSRIEFQNNSERPIPPPVVANDNEDQETPPPPRAVVEAAPEPRPVEPPPQLAANGPETSPPDQGAPNIVESESDSRDPAQTDDPAPAEADTSTEAPAQTEVRDQEELDDKFDNFDAETCEWVEDMPRRLHEAPGCGRGRTMKICVGYVVCNRTREEGKFIRASTCSEENCSDAKECTKDRHYWSSPGSENDQKYIHRDIRNLIESRSASPAASGQ